MIVIKKFQFNNFGVNTYVVSDDATSQAAIIDPGMMTWDEMEAIDGYIEENKLKVSCIINTHMHVDHFVGLNYAKWKYGVRNHASADDSKLASYADRQYLMFGLNPRYERVLIDDPVADGDVINVGGISLSVIATPGHTPGGICLYDRADGVLFSGDTIFRESVGRTDLPGGDMQELYKSIRGRILTLPDNTVIYTGHGQPTTVAHEKTHNPFV